jgi:carboxypeptidase Taq
MDGLISAGDEGAMRAWLSQSVWPLGRSVNADQLVERVSGRPLSAQPFLTHLRAKLAALV